VKTGVHEFYNSLNALDSGFRRNDGKWGFSTFYEFINLQSAILFKEKSFRERRYKEVDLQRF